MVGKEKYTKQIIEAKSSEEANKLADNGYRLHTFSENRGYIMVKRVRDVGY